MTKRKSKRLLSLLLSLVMIFTLTAALVFASDTDAFGDDTGETTTTVAKIGETKYSTLAGAINAATSGQTVTLVDNVTLSETINIYKSITLDLGSYTITSTASGKAIYTTQTLTIKADGGGITSSTGYAVLNQKGSGTGTLTINGGTYSSSADHAIYNLNGTVTVESGTISTTVSGKAGIYNTEGGTVTVNGGSVSGAKYGIYNAGAVKITGGSVTATADSYFYGVYLTSSATADISGGTIKGYEGLRQYAESGEAAAASDEVYITISGGTFEGVTHAVNVCKTTTISGGTFTATGTKDQNAVALYSTGAAITVSGGTFSGMYSTAWINSSAGGSITIEEGYCVNTGTLTDSNSGDAALVRTVVVAVASIGSTNYASLADAISAATSGDTVTLLTNCTVDSQIVVSTTVTLDLNNYSITAGDAYTNYLFSISSGGGLTVSDDENGSISSSNRAIMVYSGGKLEVASGTVHGDSIAVFSSGGTVTVSGGTVSCYATSSNGTYTSYSAIYCDTTSGGSLSITGGEVSGYRGIINWGSTVTISGGKVSTASAACAIQQTGGNLIISGGEVTNTGTGQAVYISQGAEATISGGSITAPYEGYGVGVLIQKGTLTMTGGTVYGHNFGIGTNGTDSSSYYPNTITISGGEVSGTFGMYLPAVESTTTISGSAKITGTSTGIEIRAGSLIVNGGEISSTSTTFSTKTNGNGATTYGAGISISQHSTDKDVSVTINGGTISGYYGVYELNTYASKNSSNVTLTISSTSTAVISSTDKNDEDEVTGQAVYSASVSEGTYANTTISISGGTYSTPVDPEYCADGYTPTTASTDAEGNTTYTVEEFFLGIYGNDKGSVPATIMSGDGTSTMYVKVSSANISSYSESAYPTTSLTYTGGTNDSGKYIFAGWYDVSTDDEGNTTYTAMTSFPTETAYAKFVDANALTVKCVVSTVNEATRWRFMTSLDTLYYTAVGFTVIDSSNSEVTLSKTSIWKNSLTVTSVDPEITTKATEFSSASTRVATAYFDDAGNTKQVTYTVTPYWTTGDGTTVTGETVSFTYEGTVGALTADGTETEAVG